MSPVPPCSASDAAQAHANRPMLQMSATTAEREKTAIFFRTWRENIATRLQRLARACVIPQKDTAAKATRPSYQTTCSAVMRSPSTRKPFHKRPRPKASCAVALGSHRLPLSQRCSSHAHDSKIQSVTPPAQKWTT